jgi:hypothetical protein
VTDSTALNSFFMVRPELESRWIMPGEHPRTGKSESVELGRIAKFYVSPGKLGWQSVSV